jgi:hypothetical protein
MRVKRMPESNSELSQAIELARAGRRAEARAALIALLKQDPSNDTAWVTMAAVVDSDEMRVQCLEEALKHAPDNRVAKQALDSTRSSALGRCLLKQKGSHGVLTHVVVLIVALSAGFVLPRFLPPDTPAYITAPLPVLGVVFAIAGVDGLVKALAGLRIALHEGGFVYTKWGRTEVIPWQYVAHVSRRRFVGRSGTRITYSMYIVGQDTPISFNNEHFKDVDRIGAVLQAKVPRFSS